MGIVAKTAASIVPTASKNLLTRRIYRPKKNNHLGGSFGSGYPLVSPLRCDIAAILAAVGQKIEVNVTNFQAVDLCVYGL